MFWVRARHRFLKKTGFFVVSDSGARKRYCSVPEILHNPDLELKSITLSLRLNGCCKADPGDRWIG